MQTPPQQQARQVPAAKPRGSGRVPPPEAFDHVKRLPPPPQPWQDDNLIAYPGPQEDIPKGKKAKKSASAPKKAKAGAAKQEKKPGKPQREPRQPTKAANPAKRRRQRRLAAAVGLVVVIALGVWLSFTVLFKIQKYDVQGDSPYAQDEIIAAFGHAVGDNLYGFSVKNAEERILEALPYIESVDILRRPPSTVLFRVKMAQESYCVPYEEQFIILSASRKVLRVAAEDPANLMRIEGLSYLSVQPGKQLVVDANAVALASSAAEEASSIAAATPPQRQGDVPPPLPTPEEARAAAALAAENSSSSEAGEGEGDAGGEAGTGEGDGTEGADSSAGSDTSASEVPPEPEEEAQEANPLLAAESLEVLGQLLDALAASGLTDINWVNVADPLDLQFGWQDRIVVRLGPRTGLAEKLTTAKVLLTDTSQGLVMPEDRGTLDMTYYLATGNSYFSPE